VVFIANVALVGVMRSLERLSLEMAPQKTEVIFFATNEREPGSGRVKDKRYDDLGRTLYQIFGSLDST